MKRLLLIALGFPLLALSSVAQTTTATKAVSKTVSGNALTEDLTVPSGKTLTVATGGTATAPAWFLNTFTASTIATNQTGLGWDENGRVTLQTPIGALQFYQTGTPAVPVIYWPGKIISAELEASISTTTISASSITAANGSEAIDLGITSRSIMSPMSEWIGHPEYAGLNGVPYVADAQGTSGSLEATDGVYFPQAVVSGQSTQTSDYAGRYRTATQVRSDLGLGSAALLNTGTAAGTVAAGDDSRITGALSAATAATTYQPRAATRLVTTSGAVLATDAVVICTGAGGITLTLPAANAATPRPLQLEIINRTSGTVTLACSGSDLFEGDTSALIMSGSSWSITSDASANWYLY